MKRWCNFFLKLRDCTVVLEEDNFVTLEADMPNFNSLLKISTFSIFICFLGEVGQHIVQSLTFLNALSYCLVVFLLKT